MISIRESIMTIVVTNGRDADRESVKLRHLSELQNLAFCHEEVCHLKHIHSMHVIVILNVSPVALVNLADEAREFHLIHLRELVDVEGLEDMDG